MDRWLAVGNWLLEQEQIETYAYGVKGEDWDYDADGNVVLNYTDADIAATGSKYYIVQEPRLPEVLRPRRLGRLPPRQPRILFLHHQ